MGENLEKGGVLDWHVDRREAVRSVRLLKDLDSKVSLSKGLWGLGERLANERPLTFFAGRHHRGVTGTRV